MSTVSDENRTTTIIEEEEHSSEIQTPQTEVLSAEPSSTPESQAQDTNVEPSLETLDREIQGIYVDLRNDQSTYQPHPHESKWTKAHPPNQIIGNPSTSVQTRKATANECLFSTFLSKIEPQKVADALNDPDWVIAMQEELNQFERLKVWRLVPSIPGKSVIGTKWIFKNKKDENGVIIRNKARLVAKGYRQ